MGRYNFQSPGVAAGNAIEQFLMQREMEQRQRVLDALLQKKQAEESARLQAQLELQQGAAGLQREQFTANEAERMRDEAERQRLAQRQTKMDDVAAGERRQAQNQIGVRQMMAEGLRTGTADPRAIQLQAFGEGVDIPADVLDPTAKSRAADESATRDHRFRMQEIAAREGASGGGGSASPQAAAAPQASPGAAYALQTADRTIAAIDGVLPKINGMTAGIGGTLLRNIPGSDAANVSAELASVASNVAFNAIQAMREASKTGGALGSVSERELDLLSSVEGSIRQNQSPDNLKVQLGKIKESMERFKAAQALGGDLAMGRTQTQNPPAGPVGGGVVRWGRDAQGRPVRLP